MQTLISVIIPVYNVEKYLDDCLKSVVRQTYKNLEIFLIDDGSTDSCGMICDAWGKRDNRIIVIHQANKGLSAARNIGIDRCKGNWIVFVDSDDVVAPDYVLRLLTLAEKYNVLIAQCERINKGAEIEYQNGIYEKVFSSKEFLLSPCYNTIAVAKIYHRGIFREERYPAGKIHEDMALTYKLIYAAGKIAFINEVLYFVTKRPDSINAKERYYKEKLVILEFYKERIDFFKRKNEAQLVKQGYREYAYALLGHYDKTKRILKDLETARKIKAEYKRIVFEVVFKDDKISVMTRVLLVMCIAWPELWGLLMKE